MTYLGTEQGGIIATESGVGLGIEVMQDNDDIQPFDFSVDLLRAILWQYNEATSLQYLLNAKSEWYERNQRDFWRDWYRDVFDLRTANQFGLAVWGIILGLPLFVNTPPVAKPTFGFGHAGRVNFNNGNFTNANGFTFAFSLETQRKALQLRYVQLTGSGTVPEINRALKRIFADLGSAYLLDFGNMKQQYVFNFELSAELIYLFSHKDILPRPAGVLSTFKKSGGESFGFGHYRLNFDNGNFGSN